MGSKGERKAADYIRSAFESAGWVVERQRFDAPGWTYGTFDVRTERSAIRFPAFPCFFSCGGQASGKPIFFDMDLPTPITSDRYADQIVIAHGLFETVQSTNGLAVEFDRVGVRALIVVSPYLDTYSTKIVRQPGLERLIVMTVGKNTAIDLARAMKTDTLNLQVEAESFTCETCNLVATLPDAEPRKQTALISAHYDTTPGIEGAGDDASGTAVLLELAVRLKETARRAPVKVELVAFTGEEYGGTDGCGYGASQYARLRNATPERLAWMASLDDFGTYLGRMHAVISDPGLQTAIDPILASYGYRSERRSLPGCDVGPFNRVGIPTLFFNEDKPHSGNGNFALHSPRDNLDLIDPDKLAHNDVAIRACLESLLQNG